ncbi:hypothetical protein CPLU01_14422 [Colletotrichum plurivorum]|uniref:Uncharacterized protein n=1 Tax=Colletotrichum plurivorum TaxID=2175906 RepID=A0A8H6MZX2_9PEZI|nr:hypothetical protein CPLU01_14422 [Colletotrichum plurivorum]
MPIRFGNIGGGDTESFHLESIPLTHKTPQGSIRGSDAAREGKAARQAVARRRRWLGLSFDVVLMLLPLVFIAASQHHKPESAAGDKIQDALLLSPTIFPILFAAICGKGMKSIALYKSQTGISLRLLELLSGANSLFSALERVYMLRSFGITSMVLTTLWLLSPLGGQALSPRLLTKTRFYANSTQEATFLGPDFLNSTGQTEEFIASGSPSFTQYSLLNLYEVPLPLFERRFEQVLNTFYYAASSQIFWTGNLSFWYDAKYARQATAAVAEDLGRHYVCHWVWFGIAAAVVVLLEFIAIVNAVLRFRTRAPDIFGYVSSLTIGNKYCQDRGLEVSSALDGLEKVRALGRVRFQLADVRGADDVGRIAFVPRGGSDEVEASRVRLDRYYD